MSYDYLRNLGWYGYEWSNTATVYGIGLWDAKAYRFDFNNVGSEPSRGTRERYLGLPVRCLVY